MSGIDLCAVNFHAFWLEWDSTAPKKIETDCSHKRMKFGNYYISYIYMQFKGPNISFFFITG